MEPRWRMPGRAATVGAWAARGRHRWLLRSHGVDCAWGVDGPGGARGVARALLRADERDPRAIRRGGPEVTSPCASDLRGRSTRTSTTWAWPRPRSRRL